MLTKFIVILYYTTIAATFSLEQVINLIEDYEDLLNYAPGDATAEDVSFYLFTKDVSNVKLSHNDSDKIDTTRTTKIIIHGYIGSRNLTWYGDLTREYLKKGNFNIIHVDWCRVSRSFYFSAAENTKIVGQIIADFVLNSRMEPKKVHFIGHSLGAHTAAFAAQTIKNVTGTQIYRITALDPAGPGFTFFIDNINRLDPDDADIVDVIHTDAGFLGCYKQMGSFDIYINGGYRVQPGCQPNGTTTIAALIKDGYCSHTQSYIKFIQMVNNVKYNCKKCDSWMSYVGGYCTENEGYVFGAEDIDTSMKGICFVDTK